MKKSTAARKKQIRTRKLLRVGVPVVLVLALFIAVVLFRLLEEEPAGTIGSTPVASTTEPVPTGPATVPYPDLAFATEEDFRLALSGDGSKIMAASEFSEEQAKELLLDCGLQYTGQYYRPAHLPPLINLAYIHVDETQVKYVYAYDYNFTYDPYLNQAGPEHILTLSWMLNPAYERVFWQQSDRPLYTKEAAGYYTRTLEDGTQCIVWRQQDAWFRADIPAAINPEQISDLCAMESTDRPPVLRADGKVAFLKPIVPLDVYADAELHQKEFPVVGGRPIIDGDMNVWYATYSGSGTPEEGMEIIRYSIRDNVQETLWASPIWKQIFFNRIHDEPLIWSTADPDADSISIETIWVFYQNEKELHRLDLPAKGYGTQSVLFHDDFVYFTQMAEDGTMSLMEYNPKSEGVQSVAEGVSGLTLAENRLIVHLVGSDNYYALENSLLRPISDDQIRNPIFSYQDPRFELNDDGLRLVQDRQTKLLIKPIENTELWDFPGYISGHLAYVDVRYNGHNALEHPVFYDMDQEVFVEIDSLEIPDNYSASLRMLDQYLLFVDTGLINTNPSSAAWISTAVVSWIDRNELP